MSTDDQAQRDLLILQDMVTRLRSIPSGDDDDAVRERMALRAEWNNDVAKLARLDASMRHGELSPKRLDELAAVARALSDLFPGMTARRYRLPDAAMLARLAGRPTPAQPS